VGFCVEKEPMRHILAEEMKGMLKKQVKNYAISRRSTTNGKFAAKLA